MRAPENFGVPFYATVEAMNVKVGTWLEFAKTHHKIQHRRKSGRGPGLDELHKISGFACNIYAVTKVSDLKFSMQLGFAKAHHKITPRGKSKPGLGLGSSQIFGVPL